MTGKKTVLIVVLSTLIALALTWFILQFIIDKYDLESAINYTQEIAINVPDTYNLSDHNIA